MRELKVPFALDANGEVASALTAPHGARYSCPDCRQPLTLRRRRGSQPHFTHHGHALRNCTGESVSHQAAKHLLRGQVEQELHAHGRITWHLLCPGATGTCRDHVTFAQHHSVEAWDAVILEIKHETYRFDVAVTYRDHVLFGFEVFFRHEVPDEKAQALNIPWLELRAEEILAYHPRLPHRDRYSPIRCPTCAVLADRLAERSEDDRSRNNVSAAYHAEADRVATSWQAILRAARSHLR